MGTEIIILAMGTEKKNENKSFTRLVRGVLLIEATSSMRDFESWTRVRSDKFCKLPSRFLNDFSTGVEAGICFALEGVDWIEEEESDEIDWRLDFLGWEIASELLKVAFFAPSAAATSLSVWILWIKRSVGSSSRNCWGLNRSYAVKNCDDADWSLATMAAKCANCSAIV